MDIVKFIEQLVPIIGQQAADAIAKQIKELISDESPQWQKTILALIADAVEKFGVKGIEIALDQIEKLLDDKVPEIDWANLMVASDLVATLQKLEADEKSNVRDFLAKTGAVLGPLLAVLIRTLLNHKE
jgi:hypothetical protein